MTDLQKATESLRSAVDAGDLGAIADGVAVLEQLTLIENIERKPAITVFRYSDDRVAFNIRHHGATIFLRLNMSEIRHMIAELRLPHIVHARNGLTKVWWAWGSGNFDDDPPICLYRDDWFCIDLPHNVGDKFLTELEKIREGGLPSYRPTEPIPTNGTEEEEHFAGTGCTGPANENDLLTLF